MFQRKIQLTDSEILTVVWNNEWSNLTVKYNGSDTYTFNDKTSLETGAWLTLPNNKPLLVRLIKKDLEIWDGNRELVSGLGNGESDHLKSAQKALMAYGVLFVFFGLLTVSINDFEINLGIYSSISAIGLAYIFLSLWAMKKRAKTPIQIALGVHVISCILLRLSGGIFSLAIMGVLAYYLYKGVSAKPLVTSEIQELKDNNLLDDGI